MKIIVIILISLLGCTNTLEVEVEKIIEVESPLEFSSTATFAVFAKDNPWNGKPGMILFVKAFNASDSTWYGRPELNTYVFIPNQNAPGELISTGVGIMTSSINQFGVPVPSDTLANEIPGFDIRRTLTFAPVDWSINPLGVWTYWRFVEQAETLKKRSYENKIYISNPKLRLNRTQGL